MDPCPACNRLARSAIQAAQIFGETIARKETFSQRVCREHLPLVVGFTAPRELARWLLRALAVRHEDPSAFHNASCPLCDSQGAAREEARRLPVTPTTCDEHGGEESAFPDSLRKPLSRIADGARLEMDEERRILRTALVLYASVRGTSAFIPRID